MHIAGKTITIKELRLVNGKFTKKSWLETADGERVTRKFKLLSQRTVGPYVFIGTELECIVYHVNKNHLLYSTKEYTAYNICQIAPDIFSIILRDKMGYRHTILYNGKGVVISREISDIEPIANGLIKAKKGDLWGYVDEKLSWVISPRWRYASDFNKFGYAEVSNEGNYNAIINKTGDVLLESSEYGKMQCISENLIIVGKYHYTSNGVIDIKGNVIIPMQYSHVEFKSGHFIVKNNNKFGLMDTKGNTIFECIYPEIIETPDKFIVHDFARKEVQKSKEIIK